MKFKPKKVKIIKIKNILDTDRDGVPDWKDCEPFNPWKHVKDPGDWMETREPKPTLYGEQKEWMETKKYKRRPRTELGKITADKLEERAVDRYGDWGTMADVVHRSVSKNVMQIAPPEYEPEIKGKSVYYPHRKNTIRLFDKEVGVYHYVDVSELHPRLLLSVTDEDKKMIGDERKIKKYFFDVR